MNGPATKAILALGPGDAGRPVSAAEFAAADFAGPFLYERAGGRLVVAYPDGEGHVNVTEPFRDRLGAYRLARPDVVDRVVSQAWVRVDGGTDRIGDIGVYLAGERSGTPISDRVPELMIEVVSLGRESRERDYDEKRAEYFRLGVIEYVIVDRFEGKVAVLTRRAGGYAARVLARGDTYETPLLPGLAIPLAEVLGP